MPKNYLSYIAITAAVVVLLSLIVSVSGITLASPAAQPVQQATATPAPAATASLQEVAGPPGGYQGPFNFGQEATEAEIAAWDIDIGPTGANLPAGEGTVAEGGELFQEMCAGCHGPDGTDSTYAVLVNPYDPEAEWPQTPRTVGNYWPFATTVYDYINRAMPYNNPNTLEPDQVYALTAWLLYQNEIIAEDQVMNAESLPRVEMPAHDRFIPQDPRATYRYR